MQAAHALAGNRTRTVTWGGRHTNRYTNEPGEDIQEHSLHKVLVILINVFFSLNGLNS